MNGALYKFKVNASIVIVISALFETIFFFSLENLFASLVLLLGWFLLITITLTKHNLKYYPVSFMMLIGMAIFHYLLPLPLTLLELKPVTFNMRVPLLTFSHHLLFVLVIVLTHKIYTKTSNRKNIFRKLLRKSDFYLQPTNEIIWKTAIIGLFSSVYIYFILGVWQMDIQDRSLIYYISTIMSGYIWMPLIILFPKYRSKISLNSKKTIKYILLYSVFVFIVAIASNWRTVLFSGIFMVVGLFGMGLLQQHFRLREILTPKKIVLLIAAFIIVTGPLIDFATAMVAVRGERTELPALQFLARTIDVYSNNDELELVKNRSFNTNALTQFSGHEWNESYLNNIVLNRFSNLKISDNSMFYAKDIGYQNEYMQEEILNQIYAFIPNIFLSFTSVDQEIKILTGRHSIGDALYGLSMTNSISDYGGAVITAMPGVGMAIFGYWYLVIIIPLFIVIFTMFDSFVDIKNGKIIFSYFFFLMFFLILNYFNDRHVFVYEFKYVLRTYFESVIVFLLTMKIIKSLSFNIVRKFTW